MQLCRSWLDCRRESRMKKYPRLLCVVRWAILIVQRLSQHLCYWLPRVFNTLLHQHKKNSCWCLRFIATEYTREFMRYCNELLIASYWGCLYCKQFKDIHCDLMCILVDFFFQFKIFFKTSKNFFSILLSFNWWSSLTLSYRASRKFGKNWTNMINGPFPS